MYCSNAKTVKSHYTLLKEKLSNYKRKCDTNLIETTDWKTYLYQHLRIKTLIISRINNIDRIKDQVEFPINMIRKLLYNSIRNRLC